MPKIYWIDKPIKYKFRNQSTFGNPEQETTLRPGWYYTAKDDDENLAWTPFENLEKKFPHFEISIGDKVITRNGSIMKVGGQGYNEREDKPNEVQFWFFIDAVPGTYYDPNHEGSLTYYDKYLNHSSGNHVFKDSIYDIVSLYDDTKDKCPCCNRRFDNRKG